MGADRPVVLGILGSGSASSVTRRGLSLFAEAAASRGLAFDLLDLVAERVAVQAMTEYDDPPPDSQTRRLRDRVGAASAVVLATPVHHGSYSGLLKNALDHLEGDALDFTPVGLLAAGGNPRSAAVACEHLRSVVRAMGGWSAPTHVGTGSSDFDSEVGLDLVRARSGELADEICAFLGLGREGAA